ncbi:MAG: LytTR family DNA-binding domain-containing protein [Flavobacterium sp.]|jgi:two-component system LytT family response regulator|uniref:LytR/AlgR family response regulator transcription factor n=1 Tax=Flavobacterium sp. TaxID=239 RepID=UPI0022C95F0A|nr:LytTR family DNA-binding domain-containing protein [Flavobacterium sp.]MCZ8330642.1 LytTR family DNA-binding domain-containing protein [Flavobacterium sp.]
MIKIKVIIVDDEPLSREGLIRYIEQIDFLELIETFDNPLKVIPFLATSKIDLILLDIQMPYLNGFDFLKNLKNPPLVIFHTAYPSYALESYQLDVIDYLVKPVLFDRFQKAISKAYDYHLLKNINNEITTSKAVDFVFVKSEGRLEKILFEDILYLEAMQNYTVVYHKNAKTIVLQLIKHFEELLPSEIFVRIHKSYIISIAKVDAIEGNMVIIGNKKIPFNKQIKDELFKKLSI